MKIVVLDGQVLNPGDISWEPLQALGELVVYPDTTQNDIAERVQGADVVLVNKVRLGTPHFPALSRVRLIGLLATGYDNVDVAAFQTINVPVCNVVAYGIRDVAQHAFALLLELCNNCGLHNASVQAGKWRDTWCYWEKPLRCLTDLTIGILGFGAIGRCVGQLANAFGMRVLACNRSQANPPSYTPFAYVSAEELFARSDVISLHCPLTDQTRAIINEHTISTMRPGVFIVNTARGALLDEEACAKALEKGHIGGLACDVLAHEPPTQDNPLLRAKNTIITPHMAWATSHARQNIIDLMATNIANWFAGKPTNIVNAVSPQSK